MKKIFYRYIFAFRAKKIMRPNNMSKNKEEEEAKKVRKEEVTLCYDDGLANL